MSQHSQGPIAAVTPSTTGPAATDQVTSAGAVQSNVNFEETSSTIGTLADLKRKSPKIYNFMMLSIAQNICIQMNRQNERLIEKMKQMRDDD